MWRFFCRRAWRKALATQLVCRRSHPRMNFLGPHVSFPSMRHWLLILLIALLPLRAWAGDAMVVAMPSAPGTAAHCADHPSPTDVSDLTSTADGDQQTHDLCDVCNGPAMTAGPHPGPDAAPLPQALLAPERSDFASAVLQRGHKPPIA